MLKATATEPRLRSLAWSRVLQLRPCTLRHLRGSRPLKRSFRWPAHLSPGTSAVGPTRVIVLVLLILSGVNVRLLPSHDDLVLPLWVEAEDSGPFPLEDTDVPLLFLALLVPGRARSAAVVIVLHIQRHPLTPHHRAMSLDVGAREIIVLLERHLLVEGDASPIDNEKITKDKMMPMESIPAKRPSTTAQHVHAPKFGLWGAGPTHLREDEARRSNRGDDQPPGRSVRGVVRVVGPLLRVRTVAVLPCRDIVRKLNACLAHLSCISQCFIACRCQSPTNDGLQAKGSIVLDTLFINIPCCHCTRLLQVGVHHHDVAYPLDLCSSPRRHYTKMKLVLLW
mmetsp:Transcript_64808/g.163208  ORF Transcript_64808/g.163208 Transcript_64808/m.163208 type:complete len:338 (-) Transcript_64808:701-1714(-)